VFYYVITGAGNNKTGGRADVERILTVAARPYDVDGFVFRQVYGDAHFQQGFPEPDQLFYGNAAHHENGNQAGYLGVVVLSAGNVMQYPAGFVASYILVLE
jgi:hypothetical protein